MERQSSKLKFLTNPNKDPKTGIPIKIGGKEYKHLEEKYGTPKIKSPKTQKKISVNKGEYKKLIKEGYTDDQLLYGTIHNDIELPSDIHYKILKEANQNPNYINKNLNYKYTQDVMGNNCLINIKQSEFKNYVESNKPYLTCEFVVTPIAEYNYSYYHGIIRNNEYEYDPGYSYHNSKFIEYVKTDDDSDKVGKAVYDELPFGWTYDYKNQNELYELPKTSTIIAYDLVTSYYVLKRRLSCNVAKKAVIDTLDYIVQNTYPEKVYLYLLGNAKIMGITMPNMRNELQSPEELDKINEYIDYAYPIIRRYLNILDDTNYVSHPKYVLGNGKEYVKNHF